MRYYSIILFYYITTIVITIFIYHFYLSIQIYKKTLLLKNYKILIINIATNINIMKIILCEIIIYYLLCAQSAGIGASKILLVG